MAPFFSDAFVETSNVELPSHTPDVGTGYTRVWQDTTAILQAKGATDNCSASANVIDSGVGYTADATYPSADYEAEWTYVAGSTATRPLYILIRYTDTNNMAAVRLTNVASGCQLYKKVSGVWSTVGSAVTIAVGSVCKIRFVGTTLELFDDTVSVASGTVSDVAAAGKAGIASGGGAVLVTSTDDVNTISIIDDFSVTDLGGGGGGGLTKQIAYHHYRTMHTA